MDWLNLMGKGLFSGAVIVAASEIAKKSTVLYNDTKDSAQVADFAESILWLVIPSMALFLILPVLLRRGWEFEAAMGVGILLTIIAYAVGVGVAKSIGNVS